MIRSDDTSYHPPDDKPVYELPEEELSLLSFREPVNAPFPNAKKPATIDTSTASEKHGIQISENGYELIKAGIGTTRKLTKNTRATRPFIVKNTIKKNVITISNIPIINPIHPP